MQKSASEGPPLDRPHRDGRGRGPHVPLPAGQRADSRRRAHGNDGQTDRADRACPCVVAGQFGRGLAWNPRGVWASTSDLAGLWRTHKMGA